MTLRTRLASAASVLSFSHLVPLSGKPAGKPGSKPAAGSGNRGKRAGDDDDSEQDQSDGNSKRGKRAADDDNPGEDDDGQSASAEEDDDDTGQTADDGDKDYGADDGDEDAEEGDGADDDEPAEGRSKKGKRARRADDDEEEMRGNSPIAKARRRERARCAAIFAAPEAARNVALAASLAFNTALTRREAIAVMRAAPAGHTAPAGMRSRKNPDLGAGGDINGRTSRVDRMAGLMAKAQGRRS